MEKLPQVAIDEAAVSRLIETRPRPLMTRIGGGLMVFVAVFLAVVLIPELAGDAGPGGAFTDRLILGFAGASILAAWTTWRAGRPLGGETVAEVGESIRREWRRVAGPGWGVRVLATGSVMGLAIGVPVGALMAFGGPPEALPGGSRVVMVLVFTALTLGWTLPFAFGTRLLVKRSYRKFIRGP